MRFSIFNLLVALTVVAVILAFDPEGPFLFLLILLFVLVAAMACLALLLHLVLMFTAYRLAPYFYSRSRGNLRILRLFCGREYTAWALSHYAAQLYRDGRYECAITAYSRILEFEDSSAEYWAYRGAVHYEVGDLEPAVDDLTQALAIDPEFDYARTYRGYARFSLGDYEGTISDLKQIQCEKRQLFDAEVRAMIAYYRGLAGEQLHDWQGAIDDYILAHHVDPSQNDAGIALARLQACCPVAEIRSGAKALDNAHRMCIRTEWNDWIAISVLAAAHAENGDFESAVKYANTALQLAPNNEKAEREKRIEQFKQHIPFRMGKSHASDVSPVPNERIRTN